MQKCFKPIIAAFLSLYFLNAYAGACYLHPWRTTVDAYLWALNMQGEVTLSGQKAKESQSFSDILHQMKVGGMLWVSTQKNKLGLFLNSLYSVLHTSENQAGQTVKSSNTFSIIALGVSYQAYQAQQFSIAPYFGARYTLNDVTVNAASQIYKNNQNWWQPFLGSRFIYQISKNWSTTFAADIAYANPRNKSVNAALLFSYHPVFNLKNSRLVLGYRFLHQYYKRAGNQFRWDMNLFGPIVGVSFNF